MRCSGASYGRCCRQITSVCMTWQCLLVMRSLVMMERMDGEMVVVMESAEVQKCDRGRGKTKVNKEQEQQILTRCAVSPSPACCEQQRP